MFRIHTRAARALLVTLFSLTACGGGGGAHGGAAVPVVPSTSVPGGASAYTGPLASASITLRIPGAATSTHARKPAYVSSATRSVAFVLNTSSILTPAQINAYDATNFGIFNITTPPNATCVAQGADFVCTLAVKLPPGSDGITLTTYDATSATGNVLSKQIMTLALTAGIDNSFNVTLDANAASLTVSGSGSCQNGPVGTAFGDVGTMPVTFSVSYLDPAGKTVVAPGLPIIAIKDNTAAFQTASGTINGTGGTVAFTINQAAQTFTLTPSTSSVTGAAISVQTTPANSNGASDGLAFTLPKSFTFSTGTTPGSGFLAVAEMIAANSGQVAFFHITLGGSGATDTFAATAPTTLAVTNSTNEGKPDVATPQGLAFDTIGDLLIANAGNGTASDRGDLACVPAGAIASGANSATTTSTNAAVPTSIAYDSRDGSVALGNTLGSATYALDEDLLSGNYIAAPTTRDIVKPANQADTAVANVPAPTLANGTFATALTTGTNNSQGGSSKIAILSPAGVETDITSASDKTIDDPVGLAWDPMNQQLVIANDSYFTPGSDLDFYAVTPAVVQVKTIGGAGNAYFKVATSADGHVAAVYDGAPVDSEIQVYDNTPARNTVGGPIPFNGTTSANGGNYIFDTGTFAGGANGSEVVEALTWLSNTKLLVALTTQSTGKQGLYIFDISSVAVQPAFGFDDQTGNAFAAFPKQTGFQATSLTPFATAYKP